METRHVNREHLYFDRQVGLLQGEENTSVEIQVFSINVSCLHLCSIYCFMKKHLHELDACERLYIYIYFFFFFFFTRIQQIVYKNSLGKLILEHKTDSTVSAFWASSVQC